MKHQSHHVLWLGIVQAILVLYVTFTSSTEAKQSTRIDSVKIDSSETLKVGALKVLQSKCNVCHKKQNPFMVFKAKNMEKRASKINNMVFITGKMPKGDQYTLTQKEYDTLNSWISSLKLN